MEKYPVKMLSTYAIVTLVTFAYAAVIESRLTKTAQYRILSNYEQPIEVVFPRLIECALQLLLNRETYGKMTRFDPYTCSTWYDDMSTFLWHYNGSKAYWDILDDSTAYLVQQFDRIDANHPPVSRFYLSPSSFPFLPSLPPSLPLFLPSSHTFSLTLSFV